MKPNQTERATRLECLKIAAGVAMQLKIPPKDVVTYAKAYYEFVNTSNEDVERVGNGASYPGQVFHPMAERL